MSVLKNEGVPALLENPICGNKHSTSGGVDVGHEPINTVDKVEVWLGIQLKSFPRYPWMVAVAKKMKNCLLLRTLVTQWNKRYVSKDTKVVIGRPPWKVSQQKYLIFFGNFNFQILCEQNCVCVRVQFFNQMNNLY